MNIYFDNSATTKVFPEVSELVIKIMTEDYANPSAKHVKGMEAENYIKEARERIAKTLKVDGKEIIFTSGGTEANNMALIGGARANQRKGKHLITTKIEHPSVYNAMATLEEEGFEISYLNVNEDGHISLTELKELIREDTILISIMQVNNEMGAVQELEKIGKLIKEINENTLFHVDRIQSYGKYEIRPKREYIDLLSVSGHKLHAPKGVGFLYIKDGVKIKPLIYGGGQQWNMRAGTENVPGVAGLGLAAKMMYENHQEKVANVISLKDRMIDGLNKLDKVKVNSKKGELSAPQIVSASFEGVRSEVLLHALEDKGIYVSSGSACSSKNPNIGGTLKGIGLDEKYLDGTLRFSFGSFNQVEEIDTCLHVLGALLPMLRRYQRG